MTAGPPAAAAAHETGPLRPALGRLALLAAALALAGCPAVPRAPEVARPWQERREALLALAGFALRGRVAVAAGGEGFNARLRWEQDAARSLVSLDGPLGVGGVRISTDGDILTVVTSKGETLDSAAARAELLVRLGFDPPLESLRYWVLGVPNPSSTAVEVLDEQQRLASLEQEGWRIEYESYTTAAGHALPQRLTARLADVRVRLIVDAWELQPAGGADEHAR